ncbi:hypothetical protein BGX38DRAFT_1146827 [Terfezia claveryi]|nr:hypothetical protein BGX38DRAFT_1146827 [Terfezia claveryi]
MVKLGMVEEALPDENDEENDRQRNPGFTLYSVNKYGESSEEREGELKLAEEKEELWKVIWELKGELSREKILLKGRFVEEFEGMMSFLEEAEFWKKRCEGAEERSAKAESARDKVWEKNLEEQVKRKKRKGANYKKVLEDTPPAKTEEDMVMLDPKPEQGVGSGREGRKDVAPVTPPINKKTGYCTSSSSTRDETSSHQTQKDYKGCRQGVRRHEGLRDSRCRMP